MNKSILKLMMCCVFLSGVARGQEVAHDDAAQKDVVKMPSNPDRGLQFFLKSEMFSAEVKDFAKQFLGAYEQVKNKPEVAAAQKTYQDAEQSALSAVNSDESFQGMVQKLTEIMKQSIEQAKQDPRYAQNSQQISAEYMKKAMQNPEYKSLLEQLKSRGEALRQQFMIDEKMKTFADALGAHVVNLYQELGEKADAELQASIQASIEARRMRTQKMMSAPLPQK